MSKEVGQRLKQLRKKHHYTQRDVADFLNLSQSLMAKVETGERNLKLTEILKLSSLYMVPEEYILYGEGEPGRQFFVKDNKKIRLETIQRMNKICSNLLEMSELYEKHYGETGK